MTKMRAPITKGSLLARIFEAIAVRSGQSLTLKNRIELRRCAEQLGIKTDRMVSLDTLLSLDDPLNGPFGADYLEARERAERYLSRKELDELPEISDLTPSIEPPQS